MDYTPIETHDADALEAARWFRETVRATPGTPTVDTRRTQANRPAPTHPWRRGKARAMPRLAPPYAHSAARLPAFDEVSSEDGRYTP